MTNVICLKSRLEKLDLMLSRSHLFSNLCYEIHFQFHYRSIYAANLFPIYACCGKLWQGQEERSQSTHRPCFSMAFLTVWREKACDYASILQLNISVTSLTSLGDGSIPTPLPRRQLKCQHTLATWQTLHYSIIFFRNRTYLDVAVRQSFFLRVDQGSMQVLAPFI